MENENQITYFGQTDARNKRVPFGIKSKDRSRHMYVIGKTGMGKSTLLENMAIQDIRNGNGFAFVDPHGKTAEMLLDYVPAERVKDILYFAPFDTDFPVSFNVMEDVGADKRHLVSNGLMSAFKKIWVDAWSARMEYILNNILLALLEYPNSTLLGVNRMLADKDYRKRVVDHISDVSVKAFWTDEFARYGDRYMQEAGAAIQNKIGQFIANPLVRNIIGQPKSTFDLRKMMDERKIIILNLSKGRVGEANANLLGSMFITKIYLAAMSRADTPDSLLRRLPNFYLYVDEFQSFANESFADILSEARKYKLNLTIAHQYIEQMSDEVRAAVFGNVGTMISFRVGAYDAEVLEKEFAPDFTAQDMVNLGIFQTYLKLMIDGVTSPPFSATTLPPIENKGPSYKSAIVSLSRGVYANPRDKVEREIREWHLEGVDVMPAPRSSKEPREMKLPKPAPTPTRLATPARREESGRDEAKRFEDRRPEEKKPTFHEPFREAFQSHNSFEEPALRPEKDAGRGQQNSKPSRDKKDLNSEKHLAELRSALASVLNSDKDKKKPVPVPEPVKNIPRPEKKENRIEAREEKPKAEPEAKEKIKPKPSANEPESTEKKPREVSEEILRKVLKHKM